MIYYCIINRTLDLIIQIPYVGRPVGGSHDGDVLLVGHLTKLIDHTIDLELEYSISMTILTFPDKQKTICLGLTSRSRYDTTQ